MRAELIFEFQGSRNLNTNPFDITGLEGDAYDYEVVAYFEVEGLNSELRMTFNVDVSVNYRRYFMQGDGSSAIASVSESDNHVTLDAHSFSYAGLSMVRVAGESGSERRVTCTSALSAGSGDTRIRLIDSYWKNTVDEITSIQLSKSNSVTSDCHIMIYRTPKAANLDGWEYVDRLEWTTESTAKSFTGLDGDRDEEYRIVTNIDSLPQMRINNDSGSNYELQQLFNSNGVINANNTTQNAITLYQNADTELKSQTGNRRLFIQSGSQEISVQQVRNATWYTNTVTNITALNLNTSAISITGTAQLYRKKRPALSPDTLPFRVHERVEINGDFSAGYLFSGLEGNKYRLIKLEYSSTGGAGNIDMDIRINSSATANTRQRLTGSTSSVTAQSSTDNTFTSPSADVSNSVIYLYPQTGSQRAMLIESEYRENTIFRSAMWHADTVTEITEILILATSTTSTTGTLTLSILD